MTKEEKLDQLNTKMSASCTCELKTTALNVVFGAGSADADIVFIGEAPGKKEDETGKPFIGASGKMLDDMLETINIKREDIYITNIVKYRPPDNRDPNPAEIVACWNWLCAQVSLIDPKLIIPLGRHATGRFVKDVVISKDHGTLHYSNVPGLGQRAYFALYHPAAALYNGSLKQTLFDDFAKIPQILQDIESK